MKRARQDEYVDIVKKTQVKLNENREEWLKYARLTDYFKKNAYEMEQMDGDFQYSKQLNEPPYAKSVTVSLNDGVFQVFVTSSEPGRGDTFGKSFTNEKELTVYLDKVATGQITEEIKRDWGDSYQKLFKQQLLKNSEGLKNNLEGNKKKKIEEEPKKKKKAKKANKDAIKGYGKGYRGYWGATGITNNTTDLENVGTGDVGTSDGGGE